MAGPLHGVTVLDLSRLLPGPFCTQLLVDLGATVIKVEDTQGGDYLRHTPPLLDDGQSALFHAVNRGKRSVTLDLKTPADRDAFLSLCTTADVVVESFRPGVMEKLGLSAPALHDVNPRLVVCRISGYGQEGPLRLRAGHDLNYLARAGALGMMKVPSVLPVQVADLAGGAWPAALQICAALYGRERSGRGAVIDVSMTDGVLGLLSVALSRVHAQEGPVGGGEDLLVGKVACYGVYPSADGFLAVGALEPKFWSALCAALELPELLDRNVDHGDAADDVRAILGARLRQKTNAAWMALLGDLDCCVEPVLSPEEALKDAAARGLTVDVTVGGSTLAFVASPLSTSGAQPSSSPAPHAGADNLAILGRA